MEQGTALRALRLLVVGAGGRQKKGQQNSVERGPLLPTGVEAPVEGDSEPLPCLASLAVARVVVATLSCCKEMNEGRRDEDQFGKVCERVVHIYERGTNCPHVRHGKGREARFTGLRNSSWGSEQGKLTCLPSSRAQRLSHPSRLSVE